MNSPLDKIKIEDNIKWLKSCLAKAINSPTKSFDEIKTIDKQGLYLIFDDSELLYIGMTRRQGKKRLGEITTDYRSHSFNKKIFAEHLRIMGVYRNDQKDVVHVLTDKIAKELIENKRLTSGQFRIYQAEVNKKIKSFKFKFLDCNLIDLPHIEHFAIAVLKPLYND